jgi:hypothetical protein
MSTDETTPPAQQHVTRTETIDGELVDAINAVVSSKGNHAVFDKINHLAKLWRERVPIGRAPRVSTELVDALYALGVSLNESYKYEGTGPAIGRLVEAAKRVREAAKPWIALRDMVRGTIGPGERITFETKREAQSAGDRVDWYSVARWASEIQRCAMDEQTDSPPVRPDWRAYIVERTRSICGVLYPMPNQGSPSTIAAVNDAINADAVDFAAKLTSPVPSTFAAIVERTGAHWRAVIRFGVRGSRALLGTIVMRDTEVSAARTLLESALKSVIVEAVDRIVSAMMGARMIDGTAKVLAITDLKRDVVNHMLAELRAKLEDKLGEAFGVTVTP